MIPTKRWLESYPWEVVVYLNVEACKVGEEEYKISRNGHDPARNLWEKERKRDQTLKEVIELCRECHRLAPFAFFNSNTFATLARSVIEEIGKQLNEANAHIFRGVVEHYVAGTIQSDEFESVYQNVVLTLETSPSKIHAKSKSD
jgi:hypothetical protein